MSDEIKDGGPAFPRPTKITGGAILDQKTHCTEGVTLRDYFAAKAVSGLMTRVWNEDGKLTGEEVIGQWAASAYAVADAMLKAREAA